MSYSEAMEEKMELVEKTQNQETSIEEILSTKGINPSFYHRHRIYARSNGMASRFRSSCRSYVLVCPFLLPWEFFLHQVKASTGLFTGFAKVFIAAWINRRLDLGLATQPINSDGVYYYSKDLKLVAPSNNLRFLNKACIVRDPDEDLKPDGSPTKPWELCTVSQVETLKSLIRVIPIWSTGFMTYMTLSQNSIPVLQAKTMDRHITTSFDIPAGSFALFTITTLTIWVAFYDRVTVPVLARYAGKPNGISATIRMVIGLLLSCISMAVAGIVERIRRRNISTVVSSTILFEWFSGGF
ncbi:protein NRT1/ PTR FAMILY 1.1-like isoform X1 [Papaver somniferum]|uniref:protein NRT1/ PTR FAMILY 1.1-like isoform X1 n=2 Tax=Papaver somniferum TaxID=3469 RepID=UPI000E6F529C|nr:protein NRT1/ PTR FAMILY 1.1-like isoform X1 [Papaver somniferum]